MDEHGKTIVLYDRPVCLCVCVCHEISHAVQTRCGRTVSPTTFVIGSFERSIPITLTKTLVSTFCGVPWHWSNYLTPNWPNRGQYSPFRYFVDLWVTHSRYRTNLSDQENENGLSNDNNIRHPLSPLHLIWGLKQDKYTNNWISSFDWLNSFVEYLGLTTYDGQVVRACLCLAVKCVFSKSMHFATISVHPLNRRKCTVIQSAVSSKTLHRFVSAIYRWKGSKSRWI